LRKLIVVAGVLCALIGTVTNRGLGQGNDQPPAERFVLTGVILFDGGSGFAWLQEPTLNGGRPAVLRPGESIGPYRLTKLLEDRVELQGPAGKILVPLRNGQGSPATAIASAAPSTPGLAGSQPPGVVRPVPHAASDAVVPAGLQPLEALRKQYERGLTEAAREAQQGQGSRAKAESQDRGTRAESQQPMASQAEQRPAAQTRSSDTAAANPPAGNSKAIFLGPGDARIKRSFQSMIGVGK
jgi:hypothetical protein